MEIKVKALNEDGSVAFDGSLNKEQVGFILSVGINYLMAEGASTFLTDLQQKTDEDEEQDNENTIARH